MSKRDRNGGSAPKLIGLLVVSLSLAAIGCAVWGISKQIEYEREAERREAHYSRDTYSPARNACLLLPSVNQSDCISKAGNAAREYQRSERDLVAQRVMSDWTFLMGGAAIVGVILSIVGVFLVWTTFQEAREANHIMRMEQRPWLDFEITKFAQFILTPPQAPVAIVEIENAGKSIAFNCHLFASLSTREDADRTMSEMILRLKAWEYTGFTMMPGKRVSFKEVVLFEKTLPREETSKALTICVALRYHDHERNTFLTTKRYDILIAGGARPGNVGDMFEGGGVAIIPDVNRSFYS